VTGSILDSMPLRVAPSGPLAERLGSLPTDLYLARLVSGLAHIRLTLDTSGTAEAVKLAVTGRPDWQETAARTGAGVGTKVLAGSPTLSITAAADRLGDILDFLRHAADGLTWADLNVVTANAEQAARARRERQSPRTSARQLAAAPEPTPSKQPDPTGRLPLHLTLLADGAGSVEPAPAREVPAPAEHPLPGDCGSVHRSGTGQQTWYAVCWDLGPIDAERAAAAELFLFALGGAPFSPLFQTLRDDLGISYGQRSSVQRRRDGARAWLELAFPTACEAQVRATIDQIIAATDADIRWWLDRSRNVLLSSVLGALDYGSSQADALTLGRVIGSPTYSWDIAAHLVDGDVDRLLNRLPARLRTLSTARIGAYHG
jgi:Peptidase M16 inactive domain